MELVMCVQPRNIGDFSNHQMLARKKQESIPCLKQSKKVADTLVFVSQLQTYENMFLLFEVTKFVEFVMVFSYPLVHLFRPLIGSLQRKFSILMKSNLCFYFMNHAFYVMSKNALSISSYQKLLLYFLLRKYNFYFYLNLLSLLHQFYL